MGASTKPAAARKPRQKKTPQEEPAPEEVLPEVIPTESAEPEWASSEDIPSVPYKDITLPIMNKRVRVRFLGNTEAASLAVLPDLARFGELMAEKLMSGDVTESPEKMAKETMQVLVEKTKYMTLLAHLCTMHPDGGDSPGPSDDAGHCCSVSREISSHPRSLWTMEQVQILDEPDLDTINRVAERIEMVELVRPLSQDDSASDTEPSASTGESTPE